MKLFMRSAFAVVALALTSPAWIIAPLAEAQEVALERRIPDEYEAAGGHGLAFNNAGVATVGGLTAVRVNPGMLPMEKHYRVGGVYHWPSSGREFYQAGVVDSKTSKTAAGVTYTGYSDDYVYEKDRPVQKLQELHADSSLIRRGIVSLAQNLGSVSVGLSGQYIEAHPVETSDEYLAAEDRVKGFGLGFGIAGLLTQHLRYGISGENLTNKKIADYAPATYRAGVSYLMGNGRVSLSLDYRQRDRVTHYEAPLPSLPGDDTVQAPELKDPERMALGSFTAQVYDMVRLLGSYGQSFTDERRSLAGGIALVNPNFTLAWSVRRPYMNQPAAAHQALSLGFDMAM